MLYLECGKGVVKDPIKQQIKDVNDMSDLNQDLANCQQSADGVADGLRLASGLAAAGVGMLPHPGAKAAGAVVGVAGVSAANEISREYRAACERTVRERDGGGGGSSSGGSSGGCSISERHCKN